MIPYQLLSVQVENTGASGLRREYSAGQLLGFYQQGLKLQERLAELYLKDRGEVWNSRFPGSVRVGSCFMGMWIILIGDEDFGPELIKGMKFDGEKAIKDYGGKQFDVIFDDGYVSFQFDFDGTIKREYSPDEIAKLPYSAPQFVLMQYSSPKLLKNMIGSEYFPENVLIDCDGVDLGLAQIVDESRLLNNTRMDPLF